MNMYYYKGWEKMTSLIIRLLIAIVGIAILSWLFYRDLRKKKKVF
jgi:hypothetical protein